MRKVSIDYKNKIKEFGRELDSVLTYDNKVLGVEELYEISPHFKAGLFKTIMQGIGIDTCVSIPKNSLVNYKLGAWNETKFEYLDYGNYKITEEPKIDENTKSYKYNAYDKIVDSMIDYDLDLVYPLKVRDLWIKIFNRLNWDTKNIPLTFINSNKEIKQDLFKGINYTFRDVLDELCTISCCWLVCKDNSPKMMQPTPTNEIVDEELLSDVNVELKEKVFFNSLVFTRAVSDSIYRKDDNSINANGLHELNLKDYQILSTIDRDLYIDEMWNYVKTFNYYNYNVQTTGITYLEPIDMFTFKIGDKTYPTLLLSDETNISQGLTEKMFSDKPKESETDYKKADTTDKRTNKVILEVDKQAKKITSLITDIGDRSQKETSITQDIDRIESKVSKIEDISVNVKGENRIKLENIADSEPIHLEIYPTTTDITNLYPYSELFPSDMVHSTKLNVIFSNRAKNVVYELPGDLLFINSKVYDKFVLDLLTNKCYIIKKVGLNSLNQKEQLPKEEIIEFEYPRINLTEGDYEIYLENFDRCYIDATLMVRNNYTMQTATKVEVESKIQQSSDSINLEVSKKVGKDEVVSTINQSAEEIKITGNRFVLEADNLKIDKQGNILLSSGAKVIGGDGLLSNLMFRSDGNYGSYSILGFGEYYENQSDKVYKANCYLDIYIPENFTILSATPILQHASCIWNQIASEKTIWGYSRNVKLYKIKKGKSYRINNALNIIYANGADLEEIPNGLGVYSYNPPNHSTYEVDTIQGEDISNIFKDENGKTIPGHYILVAQSDDAIPRANSNDIPAKSGMATLQIDILGYMSIK